MCVCVCQGHAGQISPASPSPGSNFTPEIRVSVWDTVLYLCKTSGLISVMRDVLTPYWVPLDSDRVFQRFLKLRLLLVSLIIILDNEVARGYHSFRFKRVTFPPPGHHCLASDGIWLGLSERDLGLVLGVSLSGYRESFYDILSSGGHMVVPWTHHPAYL